MAREIFERGHAAAVLLYDPARDAVVLIEQFRPGAYAAGVNPWLVEVVAGIIEADRKRVVLGTSVSVRVDLGGRRLIQQKKHGSQRQRQPAIHSTLLNKTQ